MPIFGVAAGGSEVEDGPDGAVLDADVVELVDVAYVMEVVGEPNVMEIEVEADVVAVGDFVDDA